MMELFFAFFALLGAIDRIFGNKIGIGIEFENGILATLRANYQSSCRVHDLEIHGPKASAYINIGFGGQECEADILYGAGVSMYSSASAGVARETREHIDGIALAGGDKATAETAYKAAIQIVDKAVSKGILHKNTAARKKSSMTLQLNKLA
jgi:ribosomal protein S20